jgi:hypothetical protein
VHPEALHYKGLRMRNGGVLRLHRRLGEKDEER